MNHREIDAKVAECLGWKRKRLTSNEAFRLFGDFVSNVAWFSPKGKAFTDPPTFLDGNGMLLLIEEVRRQGIYLDPSHYPEGWRVDALKLDGDGIMSLMVT